MEMKRTRELTAIHYRRTVKRSVSPNLQKADLQGRCPVCGARLAVSFVRDSNDAEGDNAAQKIVFRELEKHPNEG